MLSLIIECGLIVMMKWFYYSSGDFFTLDGENSGINATFDLESMAAFKIHNNEIKWLRLIDWFVYE
jgi:hypothetical protein